jgi:cation diffusion facilitator family transporter
MSDCGCEIEVETAEQSRVLWILLAINFAMFLGEFGAGILADSAALISDSLDMLADAAVYAVSLYAVARAARSKALAAMSSGVLQLGLGVFALAEVTRRSLGSPQPEPAFMIGVAVVALVANVVCFRLVSKHKNDGVHMRASFIFSQNDVIANCAVIFGGILVALTSWAAWDLIVGTAIGCLVLWGGCRILREARLSIRSAA